MAAGVTTPEEGRSVLLQLASRLAERTADLVFLKMSTEPGWEGESLRRLIDVCLDGHARAIAETLHAFGGSLDEAEALGEAATEGFYSRLGQLAGASAVGGCA